jgi:NitT/TauT family transport system permease protein
LKSREARSLVDFSKEIPVHQAGGWTTSEKNIKERPDVIQKALNAIYGGLAWLNANRDGAIKLIAEIDDIPPDIAAVEYENGIKTLPQKPDFDVAKVAAAFELNKLLGATNLIAPADVLTDQFFAKTADQALMENRHVAGATRLAIVAALFLLWEGLARSGVVNPRMLPPASDVLATLWDLLQRPRIHSDIAVTLLEVVVSFAISVPVGVVLGIVIAESRFLSAVFKPLLFFLFSIPKSLFLPLFILAFGISFTQKVAFGFVSSFLTMVICTAAAVESIRADHVMIARSFGATRAQIVRRVYLPSMLPLLIEALRISMIFTFTGVVLAEMYASRHGIGYQISNWGETYQVRPLLAGVLLVSMMAILFNEAIRWVERKYGHWRT